MSYNGWTNYETWSVSHENDEEHWLEVAEDAEGDAGYLADQMADAYRADMPKLSEPWSNLLGAALDKVDWLEIATTLISMAKTIKEAEQ